MSDFPHQLLVLQYFPLKQTNGLHMQFLLVKAVLLCSMLSLSACSMQDMLPTPPKYEYVSYEMKSVKLVSHTKRKQRHTFVYEDSNRTWYTSNEKPMCEMFKGSTYKAQVVKYNRTEYKKDGVYINVVYKPYILC